MPSGKTPPTYPADIHELTEAVRLCKKAQRHHGMALTMYEREALVRHCGRMPTSPREAQRWKIWLRGLVTDAEAEPDDSDAD